MVELRDERERFYSRLSTIPGIRPMPSVGDWILLHVEEPSELARKINRRTSPGMASVPRHVAGAVRVPVKSPRDNELLFAAIREIVVGKSPPMWQMDQAIEAS